MTAFSDETGREPSREAVAAMLARMLYNDATLDESTAEQRASWLAAADAIRKMYRRSSPVAQEPVATKKVYIKPLRTIVEIQTAYADQIRDWLNTSTPAPPAAPVVQEPVADTTRARMHADRIRWLLKNDPDGLAFALEMHREARSIMETLDELIANPPATSEGVGADEIARIIEPEAYRLDTLIDDPNIQDIRKEWAREKANAILALLSRAGDQSNSTQKDGSR